MVLRPARPAYGLVAPDVRPAWLNAYQKFGDEWTSITLAYGQWRDPAGPYLEVMTTVTDRAVLVSLGLPEDQPGYPDEDSLRHAFLSELARHGERPGAIAATACLLPAGDALLLRHEPVWAACLRPGADPAAAAVAVTICGRGVAADAVRLGPVTDLRPLAAGHLAEFPPPPVPG